MENLFPSAALNIGLEQSTVVCIIQSSLHCPHIIVEAYTSGTWTLGFLILLFKGCNLCQFVYKLSLLGSSTTCSEQ